MIVLDPRTGRLVEISLPIPPPRPDLKQPLGVSAVQHHSRKSYLLTWILQSLSLMCAAGLGMLPKVQRHEDGRR